MSETFGDPYVVLGLKRGATESEIRSAYRRLVKLYHPDKDNSLDAQVRYRDVRLAYDILCKNPNPEISRPRQAQPASREAGQTRSFSEDDLKDIFHDVFKGYGMSGNAGWQVGEEQDDVFQVFGHQWEYTPEKEMTEEERDIPFSVGTIPEIVVASTREVFGVELLLRAVVTSVLLWITLAPVSKLLASLAIPLTLIGSAVFRYVRPGSRERNMGQYFLWSFYYGVGMSAVFSVWNLSGFPFFRFLFHVFVFYAEILPLWIHPLAWLGETISERRKRERRGY